VQAASYEWDAENRLVAIASGAKRVEFSYDGLDRRTRIVVRNGAAVVSDRRYVWSGAQLCEERDASGASVLKRYSSHGIQNLAAPELPGGNYFFTRDHLGSIREMTSASGVAYVYDYTVFGEPSLLGSGQLSDFGFTGHFQLPGFDTLLAPHRGYSPGLGRWLSRDPGGESRGLNLYAYTSDPVNNLDPYGYDETSAAGLVNQTQGYKDAKAGLDSYNKVKDVAELTEKMLDSSVKEGIDDKLNDEAKKATDQKARDEYKKLIEEQKENAKAVDSESGMLRDIWNMVIDSLGGGECPKTKPKPKPAPKPKVEEKGLWDTFWDSVTGNDASKPAQKDGPIKHLDNPMKQFETPASELY
jgi:RHS repeat-associated protein